MDILFWIILIIIVFLFISRMIPVKGVHMISTSDLKTMLKDNNSQFIDVRTPSEFKNNHIKEFQNIPLQQLSTEMGKLNPSKITIIICQSGMRSLRAAKLLKKAGFHQLFNVKSGMNAWRF